MWLDCIVICDDDDGIGREGEIHSDSYRVVKFNGLVWLKVPSCIISASGKRMIEFNLFHIRQCGCGA